MSASDCPETPPESIEPPGALIHSAESFRAARTSINKDARTASGSGGQAFTMSANSGAISVARKGTGRDRRFSILT